ncbi:MAG: hypothetical protein ACE5R6_08270 [Candidatus Heimdallarchaeota archaeon]
MSDATWRIYQTDAAEGNETLLQFDEVTVTCHKSADSLLVNRTHTGAPEAGVLTELYTFREGMKVTADYAARSPGRYRVELRFEGVPLGNDSQEGVFSGLLGINCGNGLIISWGDAADVFDNVTIVSGTEGKQITVGFLPRFLRLGQCLVIDPQWVTTTSGGRDGYVNVPDYEWWPYSNYLDVSKFEEGYITKTLNIWLSFNLSDGLLDASEIYAEHVRLREVSKNGNFGAEDTINMTYYYDNVPAGPGGHPKLDTAFEIANPYNQEQNISHITQCTHDLDNAPQYLFWHVPTDQLNQWTKPADQWANYYLYPDGLPPRMGLSLHAVSKRTGDLLPPMLNYESVGKVLALRSKIF